MSTDRRAGRPRASSRETLAEAACELFLERGYEQTAVAEITRRAGVARSSFFNYFAAKSDVFWVGVDERLDAVLAALLDPTAGVSDALTLIGAELTPDALALAITNAQAMGLAEELERDRATRQRMLQRALADRLRDDGLAPLEAEVRGGAAAAAVFAAVWLWADRAAAAPVALDALLREALDVAEF